MKIKFIGLLLIVMVSFSSLSNAQSFDYELVSEETKVEITINDKTLVGLFRVEHLFFDGIESYVLSINEFLPEDMVDTDGITAGEWFKSNTYTDPVDMHGTIFLSEENILFGCKGATFVDMFGNGFVLYP